MKKERFDFAFALGSGCACSRLLRERGLQFASFPLDWVGNPSYDSGVSDGIRRTADLIAADFAGWFERDALVRVPKYDTPLDEAYFDGASRFYFAHDFKPGGDFATSYPKVREKFDRRIARFGKLLAAARKILVLWISDPRDDGEVSAEDAEYVREVLARRYPGKDFFVLAFSCRVGTLSGRGDVVKCGGFELHAFDYRLDTEGKRTWEIRSELIGPFLDGYSVRDYRSSAEKREGRRLARRREYAKFKANGFWQCLARKVQYKLYRSLKRRLEHKGVLKGLE